MGQPQLQCTWTSGWLGINAYGIETHGFAHMSRDDRGIAEARIHWLAGDGEIYSPFRLHLDPQQRRLDLLVCFGDEPMEFDEGDESDDPADGWSVDASDPVPAHLIAVTVDAAPEHVFTAIAAVHADMFVILDDGHAGTLTWDHRWMAGPAPDDLWRPAGPGSESSPFSTRAISTEPQRVVSM